MESSDRVSRKRRPVRFCVAVVFILGVGCVQPTRGPGIHPLDGGFPGSLDDKPENTKPYVASLRFSSGPVHVVLQCAASDKCPGDETVLDVYLRESSSSISLYSVIKERQPGHIVAKIKNRHNYPYSQYGLLRNDSVFLWVGLIKRYNANGEPLRSFATFHIDADGVAKGVSRALGGRFCAMDPDPSIPAVHEMPYDGYHCKYSETVYSYPEHTAQVVPNKFIRLVSDNIRTERNAALLAYGDLWFSCSGGCCQADSWALY